ncbi:MAG: nucleoside 2-deoxyribosyltransferase [Candidatus Solibacter usitatus]|nr:nucleoside 2-deoxyribosyltransferase [Candidatus Solibacter usitatus]
MKIYFGFTVAGDRGTLETARRMVECLEAMGHQVLTRHLVDDNAREADRLLAPRAVYERDMRWLHDCDLFVGEVSGSSFGIGYEAGYALGAMRKPVMLFYRRELEGRISLLITGNSDPNCRLVPYGEDDEAVAALVNAFGTRNGGPA